MQTLGDKTRDIKLRCVHAKFNQTTVSMAFTRKHVIAALVFCTLQVNIRAQDDKAKADDVKALSDSVQSLQRLGKDLDAVAAKLYTTQLGLQDIKNNASNLAKQTILAVDRTLVIITSAADSIAQKSPSCANTQTERKTNIIVKTQGDISQALSTLNELLSIEYEVNAIKSRIKSNSFNKIYLLQRCKGNVTVTAATVDAIKNCYKQVVKEFVEFIVREGNNVNIQYTSTTSAMKRINLLPVFDKIVMEAVAKTSAEAQTILLLCSTASLIDVAQEIKKIEIDNRNAINFKVNRLMDLLSLINTNVDKLNDATIDLYFGQLFSLFNNTLNLFSNGTSLAFDKLLSSDTKKDILKNIQVVVNNILSKKPTAFFNDQTFALLDNLQSQVSEDYVKSKCQQFLAIESYNNCANKTLSELRDFVISTGNTLDALYNQADQLRLDIIDAINTVLKSSLNKVYSTTIDRVVEAYIQALASSVSKTNIDLGNTYNEQNQKLSTLLPNVRDLIDFTFEKIKEAVEAAKKLNVSINVEAILPALESLKQDTLDKVNAINDKDFDFKLPIPIIFDPSAIESSLKNCTSKQNNIDQALKNCIEPIIGQLNKDLDVDITNLQNSTENMVNFVTKLEKYLEQLVQKAYTNAYDVIKNASTNSNTPTLVQSLEKDVLAKGDVIQDALDKTKTEINNVYLLTLDSIKSIPEQIDKAVSSLALALDIVLAVNPKANLTQGKALLDKLKSDATGQTSSSISNVLRLTKDLLYNLTKQYNVLSDQYSNIIAELKDTTLANKCKNQSSNETAFISCVSKIIKDNNQNITDVSDKIRNLYGTIKNLTSSIDTAIEYKVKEDLKQIASESDIAASKIFSDFNITNKQVVYDALLNVKEYNISNILSTINQVILFSQEIDRKAAATIASANYTLIASGGAINDIVGTGRKFCSANSVDKLVKDTGDMISTASKAVLATAPDLSAVSNSLFLLAKYINSTLNNQLNMLKENKLNEACPSDLAKNGSLYILHKCILTQINKFGSYYNAESGLLQTYEINGYEKMMKGLEQLNKWYNEYVVPKSKEIINTAKQNAENYNRNCNITVDKILSYVLDVSKNHYNNFQSRISNIVNEINSLATKVASKTYKPSSTVLPRLQAAVAPVDAAVAVVLNSNKSSIITDEIKRAAQSLIDDAIQSINGFLPKFPYQALMARLNVTVLLQNREDVHKKHNESYLTSTCYNQSAQFPLIDLSACVFSLTYRNVYIGANVNTFNSLTAIKQSLENWDANWEALIADHADFLVNEQTKSAYYLANRIYKAAGLTVPKEVATAVDTNRCLQGISLSTSEFICVIVI